MKSNLLSKHSCQSCCCVRCWWKKLINRLLLNYRLSINRFHASISFFAAKSKMAAPSTAGATEVVKDTIDDILLLSALREEGKAELLEILESVKGPKCLVIDVQLGGLLNQIIVEGSRFLKDNDVEYFRELKDEGLGDFLNPNAVGGGSSSGGMGNSDNTNAPENIVYLVRPHLPLMILIANQIKMSTKSGEWVIGGNNQSNKVVL